MLETRSKQERRCQCQSAEADIGNVGSAVEFDAQQHMAPGGYGIIGLAPKNACGKAADGEAKRLQHMHENEIVLEAIAAATPSDDLFLQRGEIETNRVA